MNGTNWKRFLPIVIIFISLNAFLMVGRDMLQRWNADRDVLLYGNLLLFAITVVSFFMASRGLKSSNPHAFVRSVYGSILLKLFTCMIAAFVYIAVYQKALNKPALFAVMALYLLYTFVEVSILTKLLRNK